MMSRRVLFILLTLSLLFNACVVIGFIQSGPPKAKPASSPDVQSDAQLEAQSDARVLERVTRDLHLDENQAKLFGDLRGRQREQQVVFDDSLTLIRQDISQELSKESPDLERVRTLVGQETDLMHQRRVAGAELFRSFIDALQPQQRKMLVGRFGPGPGFGGGHGGPMGPPPGTPGSPDRGALATQPGGPGNPGTLGSPGGPGEPRGGRGGMHGPRSMGPSAQFIRRFDANHDGVLDQEEAEAARRELETKRRNFIPEGERGRRGDGHDRGPGERREGMAPAPPEVVERFGAGSMAPLWLWFDADGDGRLSDAETDAMQAFTSGREAPVLPPRR